MPPPFSLSHNTYLSNYMNTGTEKVLNRTREVVAIHKDRFVFSISLFVKKITQGGRQCFMGTMQVCSLTFCSLRRALRWMPGPCQPK